MVLYFELILEFSKLSPTSVGNNKKTEKHQHTKSEKEYGKR